MPQKQKVKLIVRTKAFLRNISNFASRTYDSLSSKLLPYIPENQRTLNSLKRSEDSLETSEKFLSLEQENSDALYTLTEVLSRREKEEKRKRKEIEQSNKDLEGRLKLISSRMKQQQKVYKDHLETLELQLARVQDNYSGQFDLRQQTEETVESLRAQNRALQAITGETFEETMERIHLYHQERKEDRATIIIDSKGKIIRIPNLSGEAREVFSISTERKSFSALLIEEDGKLFDDSLQQITERRNYKGFVLEVGVRRADAPKLLTPYVVKAEALRDDTKEVQVITLFLEKPETERTIYNPDAREIEIRDQKKVNVLEKARRELNEALEPAKEGASYRVIFKGTQRLSPMIINKVGRLLTAGKNITLLGLKYLEDEGYTAFRSQELGISRDRLGINTPILIPNRSVDYSPEKEDNLGIEKVL